jgi:hypothetical protein
MASSSVAVTVLKLRTEGDRFRLCSPRGYFASFVFVIYLANIMCGEDRASLRIVGLNYSLEKKKNEAGVLPSQSFLHR